jgi:hypothetical protein
VKSAIHEILIVEAGAHFPRVNLPSDSAFGQFLGAGNNICQQHGTGHRAGTARHGSKESRHIDDIGCHIPYQTSIRSRDPNIKNRCARLYIGCSDYSWDSSRRNNNVGSPKLL